MNRLRPVVLAIASALLTALVCVAVLGESGSASGARKASAGKEPPREIRDMLREVDPDRIESSIRTLVDFGTRNTLSVQDDPERGIGAARDWIFERFQDAAAAAGGRMSVELQSFVQEPADRIPVPTRITNVVATLRGTQAESADRVYVVSGHYDSMCGSPVDATCDAPGANDDASGVAAVLELARVMAKRPFDATIVFMAVAGEEQGLYGSTHFAEQAKAGGLNVAGMFTNDIIGSSRGGNGIHDPRSVRVFAEGVPTDETPQEAMLRRSTGGENDSPARQLARFVKESGENSATGMKVRIIYRRDRFLRGGDHIPFLERGFRSAVRFTEPNEDFDHQHQNVREEDGKLIGDLPQFVDFPYVSRVARVNGAALAGLANAPAAPADARIVARELTNDTTLQWQAGSEPDLAGYEIVWRETTDALWTHTIDVGNVTSHTVEGMSKDNFFFGVRAVDRDGNRSPVSFPTPLR